MKGEKPTGRAKKEEKLNPVEFLPDRNGRRIIPCVDDETKKKIEKLDAAKLRPPGEKGARGKVRL